jgi:NAD-dependent dihydropyrimidine dehydrogenase PreA subunit
VETWGDVAAIMQKGATWFAGYGSAKCKGTKTFALVGKINRTGLIEVPMGIPLKDVIYGVGGGILNDKKFKAVQTGGPSGGCIPASLLDLPVDYESLTQAGSIMGSGGMVVMDEDTCMVDIARYFLTFTQAESCGKCVLCRLGTKQMLDTLTSICRGEGKPGDIDLLLELGRQVKAGARCGLGQTAPNPVLTTIRYFRDEYEAHIKEHRCPALACTDLISYYITPDKCQGCGICLRDCPADAIIGGKRMVHVIDQSKCAKCGTCLEVCPPRFDAVRKVSGEEVTVPGEPVPVKAKKADKSPE